MPPMLEPDKPNDYNGPVTDHEHPLASQNDEP